VPGAVGGTHSALPKTRRRRRKASRRRSFEQTKRSGQKKRKCLSEASFCDSRRRRCGFGNLQGAATLRVANSPRHGRLPASKEQQIWRFPFICDFSVNLLLLNFALRYSEDRKV
jgi:hypothetical protein